MLQSQIESIVLFMTDERGSLVGDPVGPTRGSAGTKLASSAGRSSDNKKLTGIPKTDFSPWLTSPLLLDMMTDFYEKERRWGEREKKVKLQKGMDEGEEERERERESEKKNKIASEGLL